MSSLTAQILVGNDDQFRAGLIPTHQLLLFENEQPAWILIPVSAFEMVSPPEQRITWLPTAEHMLEDALLMIAVHVLGDEKMQMLAKEHLGAKREDWIDLAGDSGEGNRQALYAACRRVDFGRTMVLTVLPGSTVEGQLGVLKDYQADVEVCAAK